VWIVAGTRLGHVLEPLDQRARGFIVLIALNRLVPEHVRNVFGEMTVRTWTYFYLGFVVSLTRVLVSIDSCFRYGF
jgi:hypothetical protein